MSDIQNKNQIIIVSFMEMLKLPRAANVPTGLPINGKFQFKKTIRGDIQEWQFIKIMEEQ